MEAIRALHDAPWGDASITFASVQKNKSKAALVNFLRNTAAEETNEKWARFILAAASLIDASELSDLIVVKSLEKSPEGERGDYGDPELDKFITRASKGLKKRTSKVASKRRAEIKHVNSSTAGKSKRDSVSAYVDVITRYLQDKEA